MRNNNNYKNKFFALYKHYNDDTLVGTFGSIKELSIFLNTSMSAVYQALYRIRKGKAEFLYDSNYHKYNVYVYEDTPNDDLSDLQNID